ncbi:MAG: tripartite tricarboxylate transporter substrate binding protein [Burkholderiaceae bacterium]
MNTKRGFLALVLAGAALAPFGDLHAQSAWPSRPIRLIVPYPPGGGADNISRAISDRLSGVLGQPVVIENRGGAGATIGTQAAAQSNGDGYTLLMAPTAVMAVTPHLRAVPYDPASFVPVAMVSGSYGIVTVRKDLPAKTATEMISAAKAQPGKFTFGSAGLATLTHLGGEMFQLHTGVKLLHVPYKGSVESMNDLVGGRIDMIFDSVALPQIKAGNLRALAVMTPQRHPELPDVPTLAELGVGFESRSWFGVFAPKGTPADVVAKVSSALEQVLKAPEVAATLLKFSHFPSFEAAPAFAARVRNDSTFFRELIDRAHIKIE